jgi:hypothetical protein
MSAMAMARYQTARQHFEPLGCRAHMKDRSANGIRSACICIMLLTLSCLAEAADHGQLGPTSPELKAWANSLDNTLGEVCCSTADGWKPEEVEYEWRMVRCSTVRGHQASEQIRLPGRLVL